jgi:hypothetical protein
MAGQYMYHVTRENRYDRFGDSTEIRGTYWTVREANEAARRDLTDEWDVGFFDVYREMKTDDCSDYDGDEGHVSEDDEDDENQEEVPIKIRALCPEGEVMIVRVEKTLAPSSSAAVFSILQGIPASLPRSSRPVSHAQIQSTLPRRFWAVYTFSIKDSNDSGVSNNMPRHEDHVIYGSLTHANVAAHDLLLEELSIKDGGDLDDLIQSGIKNLGSSTEPYCADVYNGNRDIYRIYIEVQPVQIFKEPARKRAATNTSISDSSRNDKRARPT